MQVEEPSNIMKVLACATIGHGGKLHRRNVRNAENSNSIDRFSLLKSRIGMPKKIHLHPGFAQVQRVTPHAKNLTIDFRWKSF